MQVQTSAKEKDNIEGRTLNKKDVVTDMEEEEDDENR